MEYIPTSTLRSRQAPRSTRIQTPTGKLYTKRTVDKVLPRTPVRDTTSAMASSPRHSSASTASPCVSDSAATFSSTWRASSNSNITVFEEDFIESSDNDSDSAIVPLRISNSVREALKISSLQYGDSSMLVEPPYSTVSNNGERSEEPPVPPQKLPLSPDALAAFNGNRTGHHARATSSLDGSLTSDEAASLSCPSTPNNEYREGRDSEWDLPLLLGAEAVETLQHLSPDPKEHQFEQLGGVSSSYTTEMRECGLNIDMIGFVETRTLDDEECISAISIPSPDGFFASLATPSRDLWGFAPADITPSTGTAERFYGVPWAKPAEDIVERIVVVSEDNDTDGPPTARQEMYTRQETVDAPKAQPVLADDVYDESYQQKLTKTSTSNISRTDLWISAQETYLAALRYAPDEPPQMPVKKAQSPIIKKNLKIETKSPGKCVRFIGVPETPLTAIPIPRPVKDDELFLHAFQESMKESQRQDVIIHAVARADAIQMQRLYLSSLHQSQLIGDYKLHTLEDTPQLNRDDFSHLPSMLSSNSIRQYRDSIIMADKQRQAVHQTALARWNIAGFRCLSGGRLLPLQAHEFVTNVGREGKNPRILDLGGLPTADWAWAAALEYPQATIYTVMTSPTTTDWRAHSRPNNHRVVTCANPWTLPFSNDTFDVVSARTLHTVLRASPSNVATEMPGGFQHQDEYALTLRELHRVLRPTGILHFSLLDAELSLLPGSSTVLSDNQATTRLATMSTEFASSLRSAGYDPSSSTTFIDKLRPLGFHSTTKANLCLRAGFPQETNTMRADCLALAELHCGALSPPLAPLPSTPFMSRANSTPVTKCDPATPTTPKTSHTLVQKLSSPAFRRVFASGSSKSSSSTPGSTGSTAKSIVSSSPNTPVTTPVTKPNYPTLNLLAVAKKPFMGSSSSIAAVPRPVDFPHVLPPVVAGPLAPPFSFGATPTLLGEPMQPMRAPPAPPTPPAPSSIVSTASSLPSEANNVAALASMVGSIAWERWMLKLQMEEGREEGKLLEGVAEALEAVGRQDVAGANVGWTMCVGCARKG